MTGPTLWQADDPCPACGTTQTLTEDGGTVRVECRACGHTDTWTTDLAPTSTQDEANRASEWLLAEYEQDAAALTAWRDGRVADAAQQRRFLRLFTPGPMLTLKEG
jgi:Zn ribbon nucleic-acid-binding protein